MIFFFFLYEFFALFLHSSFCVYSAPFSTFLYIFKLFFTCKEVIRPNNNSRIFVLQVQILCNLRPEFFYFLVLGKFLGKPSVGGGNKNKNKIQKFPESE